VAGLTKRTKKESDIVPLVRLLISFHSNDGKWKDAFSRHCEPYQEEGELEVVYDEISGRGKHLNSLYDESTASFDACFVLISEDYLALSMVDNGNIMQLISSFDSHGVKVVLVHAEHCQWQSYEWIKERDLWPSQMTTLSDDKDNPDTLDRRLVDLIKDALSWGRDPKNSKSSDESRVVELSGKSRQSKGNAINTEKTLQDDFRRYLERKGYSDHLKELTSGDRGVDLCVTDENNSKPIAVFEFKLSNNDKTLDNATRQLLSIYADGESGEPDPFMYIVCAGHDDSSDHFEIYEIKGDGYETISMQAFPDYGDLVELAKGRAYGEGKYGESVYGDNESANNEETSFASNFDLRIAFEKYLVEEKGYEPPNYSTTQSGDELALTQLVDNENKLLAVLTCCLEKSEVNESFDRLLDNRIDQNTNDISYYVVCANRNDDRTFTISEYEENDEPDEIVKEEFPTYKQLLFLHPLSIAGKRACKELVRFAEKRNGLIVHTTSHDYINLQIKQNGRTAAQIHRVNDSNRNIALVLAGYQKDFPGIKVPIGLSKADVRHLSGYTSKHPAEKNWLEGNIGHAQLKHEAGVYILKPGVFVLDEIRNEVVGLLRLAKNNAENKGPAEPDENTVDTEVESPNKLEPSGRRVDVVGNVATIRIEGIGEKDRLGRENLVRTLAGMFAQTECDNGFTMAILGDWGQGKSTVMGLLRAELNKKHAGKFEFAKYNAWEYEKADNVAAGIAQEVVAGLLDISKWKMPFLRARFAWREHRSSVYLFALSLVIAISLSILMVISLPLIELVQSVSSVFPNAKTLIELITTYWPWILPLLGLRNIFKKTEHPLKVGLHTYFRLPDYGKHLGLVPVLKKDISALCKLQLNEIVILLKKVKLREKKKLIVFVDDLDRCNVDHIVKVLDAIRLVMTIPNVIVVIGIDHRIAFKAIGKHYEELADSNDTRGAGEIARDYLGKIIQLPLRLRAVSHGELKDYVFEKLFDKKNIVDDTESEKASKTIDGNTKSKEEVAGEPEKQEEVLGADTDLAGTGEGGDNAESETSGSEKDIAEAIKDKASERRMFYELVGKFEFSNPRQLLRLHNSFRFLKGYARGRGQAYDTLDMLLMLFWQEFLHNWPMKVRGSCMAELTGEVHGVAMKPKVKSILNNVKGDIALLFTGGNYAELAEFVRIVVLPHNEEGVFDTKEETDEWLKKEKKKEELKG